MKDKIHVLMTAGRGPVECTLALQGIQRKFRAYLNDCNIDFEIVNSKEGAVNRSLETIVFSIDQVHKAKLSPWLGTIKWICQSPIRKFHKRKNWFIKCEFIQRNESCEINERDVVYQTFRASGPGGQHRNKVETAVRLTHPQSGISVTATDGKSQHQNKKKAWEKFRTKVRERHQQSFEQESLDQWSEKIEIKRGEAVKVFEGLKFIER